MTAPADVVGGLFVGGASRRMGRDKALLERDGERLIDRGLRVLSSVCDEVVLVGGAPYSAVSAPQLPDVDGIAGPLAGVLALLEHAEPRSAIALAVDMPFVEPEHLEQLLKAGASAASRSDDRWDPFCAVYDTARALPIARAHAKRGELRLQRLWDALNASVVELPTAALRDWDAPGDIG